MSDQDQPAGGTGSVGAGKTAVMHGRQAAFLVAYRELGNVTAAAERCGVTRGRVYQWARADERFAERLADAAQEAAERLEHEAYRRAVSGWEEPVFQGGKQVGTVTRYSDRMLELLLKARLPERYRERLDVRALDQADVVDVLTPEQRAAIAAAYLGDAIPAPQLPSAPTPRPTTDEAES